MYYQKSGYTGSEIVRLLANHPHFSVTLLTADRKAGHSMDTVFPHLTAQEIIKGLHTSLKIVDLFADFRLRDISEYEEWYGQPHKAVELHKEVGYGLIELLREDIKKARFVANPRCYPTSIQPPLVPLLKENLIKHENIIINAKSGVSGAGHGAKEANLYSEIAEYIFSYGVTWHRHVPEIEQGLSDAAQSKVTVSFTPHLMPMIRGMQATIYVEMAPRVRTEALYQQLRTSYEIDNLVKGASGQALQNLNIMLGYPETTGLLHQPMFP
ncbi:unnamed protein product [Eruca vesicaria subsp. sativa]|uniref:Semialdehyde dehydrogenase NAD-binding domain-containing protein n=1 Tax=Eruca vesicaria subsp. sativa TaxID=29727 RepID=A0ABC8KGR6_ERUVS|nr:unnamed protein product [Eruca vesicaria subsp. sativa]